MPKQKTKQPSTSGSDSDSGPDDRNCPPPKKAKESNNDTKKKSTKNDDEGQWILEKNRQVRINEFRGRKLVDIREYYEKDGEYLPGKKGISLSVEQWRKLLLVADEVNKALLD